MYGFGGDAEDGKPLGEFFTKVYTELHDKKVSSLIIDVPTMAAAPMSWPAAFLVSRHGAVPLLQRPCDQEAELRFFQVRPESPPYPGE